MYSRLLTAKTRLVSGPAREFHVSRAARERYRLDDAIFSVAGHVVFGDVRAARDAAQRINAVRAGENATRPLIRGGDIYAMGILDEIQHVLIARYVESFGTDLRYELRRALAERLGVAGLEALLRAFSDAFPTTGHFRGHDSLEESLDRRVDHVDGRDVAIEELIVLWLGSENPAYGDVAELFDPALLGPGAPFDLFCATVREFFADRTPDSIAPFPASGPRGEVNLIELLRAPARAHPRSLRDQLSYIRTRYGVLLDRFFDRVLRTLDFLAEESRAHPGGPGPAPVLSFEGTGEGAEYARFSSDREWMPRAVLLAKSTLVWLHQLSIEYGYEIRTLDAIPDEELERIAQRGFSVLWLIGLWERSSASRRIKQLTGNPDAAASAYALYDYEIAANLGGWDALDNLRRRLWRRGVRVASDMVPNHTGIDGRWVYEHPDWFVQLDQPPFPGYTFSGEDLSSRDGVSIHLEDHYFDRSDAAVVFRHVEHGTGRHRYIYHGNDGTSMPWNDTAQLDFLNPEVREAVIQTILTVARNFPVIRFDAAMTLARKHIQRLWYPAPGQGGDIASRAEHGLSHEEFMRRIPVEFWREVVDRVAEEVPDTLLLAEAFWMMEGFFVRTLGMHRVYNSAFMNMLKREQNEQYRRTIMNTLEYDPQILKRFVNFMNNPDEETAVAQFGKEDKYFGVSTLMATMPGLPMFGHGQFEGLTEKYGMEYTRAYVDERPDEWLLAMHERHITPLLHERERYADVEWFRLFDLVDRNGAVNHNVFAYSNRHAGEPSLVVYNNSLHPASGALHRSTGYQVVHPDGSGERRYETLAQAIGLKPADDRFLILEDVTAGLTYLRRNDRIAHEGLFVQLDGYQRQVFPRLREVSDSDGRYARLERTLAGAGVPDLDRALHRQEVEPLLAALRAATGAFAARRRPDFNTRPATTKAMATLQERALGDAYRTFAETAVRYAGAAGDPSKSVTAMVAEFESGQAALSRLEVAARGRSALAAQLTTLLASDAPTHVSAVSFLAPLETLVGHAPAPADQAEAWLLTEELDGATLSERGDACDGELVLVLLDTLDWSSGSATAGAFCDAVFASERARRFLLVNEYEGALWFNMERWDRLRGVAPLVAVWSALRRRDSLSAADRTALSRLGAGLQRATEASDYTVGRLLASARPSAVSAPEKTRSPRRPGRTQKKSSPAAERRSES